MSLLREERKAFRDDLERTYGIHLREDDELLPVMQFIMQASKSASENTLESRKLMEEMKATQSLFFNELVKNYSAIIDNSRKHLADLPQTVKDLEKTIAKLPKIPEEVKMNQVRTFDSSTTRFLWKYFMISGIIVFISICAAAYFWVDREAILSKNKPEQKEWLLKFYNHVKTAQPKETTKYVDEHPIPKN